MTDPKYDRDRLCGDDVKPQEQELLVRLMEEAGEVVQACAKTLRWGWASVNPTVPVDEQEDNGDYLRRELYDLVSLAERLDLLAPRVPAASNELRKWMDDLRQFAEDARARKTLNGDGTHYGIVRMAPDDVLRLCDLAAGTEDTAIVDWCDTVGRRVVQMGEGMPTVWKIGNQLISGTSFREAVNAARADSHPTPTDQ